MIVLRPTLVVLVFSSAWPCNSLQEAFAHSWSQRTCRCRQAANDLATWQCGLSEARENGPVNYTNWPRVSQLVFSPSYARSDGWGEAIRANQHPARCSRFLLLEDNMLNSGFGMDIKLISVALLIAVSQQRVLLHVPGVERLYVHFTNVSSGRWCDRPPYTLDCMWKPLTHCNPPPVNEET